MKNLANCKPTEFAAQTVKIKRSVERWLKATDIAGIRNRMPELEHFGMDADPAEQGRIKADNAKRMREQAKKNLSDIFDAVFEAHPAETLEVLALTCFVEPENVDDHPMSDYMEAFAEMMDNEAVIHFFTSLLRISGMLTLKRSAA